MSKQSLKNDHLEIEYLTDALRIVGLTLPGGSNIFADATDAPPVTTSYGVFHLLGGHRLWHAPEAMPRTYIPDGEATITEIANGVLLETPTEPGTGIRKRIEVRLAPHEPSVILTHTLTNAGLWPIELAPWALTQLRLGGTAILPMPVGDRDPAGLLHNRQFSLWPYARVSDPRLEFGDEFVLFRADPLLPPFKVGYFSADGWMAYWLDGTLFRKVFEVHRELPHPDNNCNAEMYCNDRFLELETLGPLVKLVPGGTVSHTETWEISDGRGLFPAEIEAAVGI